MPCPVCTGNLIWKERSWTTCGEDPGHWSCIMCGRLIYPERAGSPKVPQNIPDTRVEIRESVGKKLMGYHLDSKKEEEVKALLRTDSIREIVAKTGVAKNTISRIRDESFTEEEKAELKRRANMKGRNKRELEKREPKTDLQNDGKNISSTDCGEKGDQEIMTGQMQVCTNPECPKPNPQPIIEFNKNAARPSGRETRCRTCTAQRQRDRKAQIEKAKAGNGRKKRQPPDPGPVRSLTSVGRKAYGELDLSSMTDLTEEAIYLERSILLAIEKKVALKLLKKFQQMVDEDYA